MRDVCSYLLYGFPAPFPILSTTQAWNAELHTMAAQKQKRLIQNKVSDATLTKGQRKKLEKQRARQVKQSEKGKQAWAKRKKEVGLPAHQFLNEIIQHIFFHVSARQGGREEQGNYYYCLSELWFSHTGKFGITSISLLPNR